MFNSQKINNDPGAWRARTRLGTENRGIRYETHYDAAASQKFMGDVIYDPRPEYDNNPNPILVAFRKRAALDPEQLQNTLAAQVHDALWACDVYDADSSVWQSIAKVPVSPEHITHARKVLERLVNVYFD